MINCSNVLIIRHYINFFERSSQTGIIYQYCILKGRNVIKCSTVAEVNPTDCAMDGSELTLWQWPHFFLLEWSEADASDNCHQSAILSDCQSKMINHKSDQLLLLPRSHKYLKSWCPTKWPNNKRKWSCTNNHFASC